MMETNMPSPRAGRMTRRLDALVAVMAFAILVPASRAEAQGAPPGCKTAMHRQFDFWIGE
jgi:hypothetical protein